MSQVNEGTHVPGEEEGSAASPELHRQQVEDKALAKGWRPLEEFKGDPEDWVDAREFLGREKLYKRISDLRGDLFKKTQQFEQDMSTISEYLQKTRETEYKRALADLKAQRRAAMQSEDPTAVEAVEEQIEAVQEEHAKAAPPKIAKPAAGPTPEFIEWTSENSWFKQDMEMTQDAISIGTGYAAANPTKTQVEVLQHVTRKIKQMYPDKFDTSSKTRTNAVESDDGTAKPRPKSKSGKLSAADLNDDERRIMNTLVKRGVLKKKAEANKITQEEQYLRDYAEAKGSR